MRSIDADALKNVFSNMYRKDYERWIKEVIDNAPTIEPFEKIGAICNENCGGYRPKGKWEYRVNGFSNLSMEYCSICNEPTPIYLSRPNYCPNCGADMRGEA